MQKLLPSAEADYPGFGRFLDLDGDMAAIGAGPGVVYVFERQGRKWQQSAEVVVPASDQLWQPVAIDGDTIALGLPEKWYSNSPPGRVALIQRVGGTWSFREMLVPPDSSPADSFGVGVALEGDTLFVGASRNDTWGENAGAVYVYERGAGGWVLAQQLRPLDWDFDGSSWGAGNAFGFSVDVAGDVAIVGAKNEERTGVAYVFRRDAGGWVQEARLQPSDGVGHDEFGYSVGIEGDDAVVGAYEHGRFQMHLDDHAGAVYAYHRTDTGWTETILHGAPNPLFWCRGLGHDVQIAGDTIVAGVPGSTNCSFSNDAYLFRRHAGAWSDPESVRARPIGGQHDDFGASVALSGSTLLVGAPWDTERRLGAVYVYDLDVPGSLSCCPDLGDRYCSPAADNTNGVPGTMVAIGSARASDDCLFLRAEDLPWNAKGHFLMSDAPGLVLPPGHVGPLCLGSGSSGVVRISRQLDAIGGTFSVGLGTRVVPGAGSIVAGSTWYFQAWYRKANHKNFTDALSVTFL